VKHETKIGRQRLRRRRRVRKHLKRHSTRPRLSVFRSHKHIYAQIIDDDAGRTLVCASTVEKPLREQASYGGNQNAASAVGQVIAQRALEAGIKQVAFDRREYKYHGRIAALADAARDAGLDLGAKKPQPEAPPEPQPKAEPKKKKKSEPKSEGKSAAKSQGKSKAKSESKEEATK
jgi:large subunit ribosomal protein L18